MGQPAQDTKPVKDDLQSDGLGTAADRSADPQCFTTTSLDALQTADSLKVMNIVDKLRRSGLSGILQLPQLVVSGDQSSGKSSVLEAITEIPFPRKENLCTRFATEIVLRRATTPSISTRIIPDRVRPSGEKRRLEAFKSTIVNFNELPTLIDEATNLMGLGGDDGSSRPRAFSRDVLSIEISGPGRPHLTLVDLPGLIHSENKMQSKEDVELIRGLVDDYIKEKRTIIMAVVSAKNDYANQIILKKCRDVDPKGHRTMGIITKPDFLETGSENEASWIELAENKDIFFELGWHVLKNRSDKELTKNFEERNASEAAFFNQGRYRDVAPDMLGVHSLRTRLSKVLFKHLKTELPALQKELVDKYGEVCEDLEGLGEKRSTIHEQRRFLIGISISYQELVKSAVSGQYEDNFFGDMDINGSVDDLNNMRRLRAVVQFFNLQFASTMRQHGHKSRVKDSDAGRSASPPTADDHVEPQLEDSYAEFASRQEEIDRAVAIKRVRKVLVRSRGRELPGTFNPLLISELFWQQAENWDSIAEYHIDKIAEICMDFVRTVIECIIGGDVGDRLLSLKIERALETRHANAKTELCRIVADVRRHPITYDPAYAAVVRKSRHEKHTAKFRRLMDGAKAPASTAHSGQQQQLLQADVMKNGIEDLLDPDMDKTSAEDALDSQNAYYKEEVKYFIGAVTKQVVERHLLWRLADETLSPMLINDMTDEEVAYVASEPEETKRMRDNLEARKAMLEKGQQTFRSALGWFR